MAGWRKIRPDTILLIGALAVIVLYTVISTGTGLIRLYRPMQHSTPVPVQSAPAPVQGAAPAVPVQPSVPEKAEPAPIPVVPPPAAPAPKPSRPVDDIPTQRQPPQVPAEQPEVRVASRLPVQGRVG